MIETCVPKRMPFSRACACFKCGNRITMKRVRRGVWSVRGNPFCSRACAQWLADEENRLHRITEEQCTTQ